MKIKKDNALINEISTMICPEMKKCLSLVMQYLDATQCHVQITCTTCHVIYQYQGCVQIELFVSACHGHI